MDLNASIFHKKLYFLCHSFVKKLFWSMKDSWYLWKSQKMKKAFCYSNCPCPSLWKNVCTSDLRISLVEKREHFSALGWAWLQRFSLGSHFSTSVYLEKLKSDLHTFFLRHSMDNYHNKILFKKCISVLRNMHMIRFLRCLMNLNLTKINSYSSITASAMTEILDILEKH